MEMKVTLEEGCAWPHSARRSVGVAIYSDGFNASSQVRPSVRSETFLARGLPPFDLRFGFGISQRPRTQTPINAAVYIPGGEKRDLLDCLE